MNIKTNEEFKIVSTYLENPTTNWNRVHFSVPDHYSSLEQSARIRTRKTTFHVFSCTEYDKINGEYLERTPGRIFFWGGGGVNYKRRMEEELRNL
jgi:hypothetical protein